MTARGIAALKVTASKGGLEAVSLPAHNEPSAEVRVVLPLGRLREARSPLGVSFSPRCRIPRSRPLKKLSQRKVSNWPEGLRVVDGSSRSAAGLLPLPTGLGDGLVCPCRQHGAAVPAS